MDAGGDRLTHECVIRRVELDDVGAIAARVECLEFRRILVRKPAEFRHLGCTPGFSERGKPIDFRLRHLTEGTYRADQRRIAVPQVDVADRRRLVQHLMGGEHLGSHG